MSEVSPLFPHVFEAIPMAALLLGSEFRIQAANSDFMDLFSIDEEILNRPFSEIVPDDTLKGMMEDVLGGAVGRRESRLRLNNGIDLRVVMKSATSVTPDGIIVLMEELSERMWLEEKFLQAEKLFAMGQLATCITHEIGNPLGIMKSTMRFLNDHLARMGGDLTMYSQVVMENIDRMHELLKDISEFSRPRKEQIVFHDICSSLSQILHFVEKECEGHGVVIEASIEDNLPIVCCNPHRLKQVFLNLVKNAIEAMPNGGKFSVAAKKVDLDGKDAVLVAVTDSGIGISEKDMKTIFKPFHTTKCNGNGLGLFIVRNIVREHNGRITVTSTEGVGTTVSILLPADGRKDENA